MAAPDAAELAGLSRSLIVERLDFQTVATQQSREACLAAAVPPHLSDDSGWNRERVPEFHRA